MREEDELPGGRHRLSDAGFVGGQDGRVGDVRLGEEPVGRVQRIRVGDLVGQGAVRVSHQRIGQPDESLGASLVTEVGAGKLGDTEPSRHAVQPIHGGSPERANGR